MAIFTSSSVAGQMARSIVPVGVLIIASLGVATIFGLRTGLYDSGIHNVIFTLSSIIIVTVLVWRNAHAIDLTEQEREAADDAVALPAPERPVPWLDELFHLRQPWNER